MELAINVSSILDSSYFDDSKKKLIISELPQKLLLDMQKVRIREEFKIGGDGKKRGRNTDIDSGPIAKKTRPNPLTFVELAIDPFTILFKYLDYKDKLDLFWEMRRVSKQNNENMMLLLNKAVDCIVVLKTIISNRDYEALYNVTKTLEFELTTFVELEEHRGIKFGVRKLVEMFLPFGMMKKKWYPGFCMIQKFIPLKYQNFTNVILHHKKSPVSKKDIQVLNELYASFPSNIRLSESMIPKLFVWRDKKINHLFIHEKVKVNSKIVNPVLLYDSETDKVNYRLAVLLILSIPIMSCLIVPDASYIPNFKYGWENKIYLRSYQKFSLLDRGLMLIKKRGSNTTVTQSDFLAGLSKGITGYTSDDGVVYEKVTNQVIMTAIKTKLIECEDCVIFIRFSNQAKLELDKCKRCIILQTKTDSISEMKVSLNKCEDIVVRSSCNLSFNLTKCDRCLFLLTLTIFAITDSNHIYIGSLTRKVPVNDLRWTSASKRDSFWGSSVVVTGKSTNINMYGWDKKFEEASNNYGLTDSGEIKAIPQYILKVQNDMFDRFYFQNDLITNSISTEMPEPKTEQK